MRPQISSSKKHEAVKCLVILTFLSTASALHPAVSSRLRPNEITIAPTQPQYHSFPVASIPSTEPPDYRHHQPVTTAASAQSQAPAPMAAAAIAAAVESSSESPRAQSATTKQHLDSSWIESLLNKVEQINEHQEEQQARAAEAQEARDDEDSNSDNQQVPSLVPTDSGEDLLETTTNHASSSNITTNVTTLSHDQTSATQYTLTNSAGADQQTEQSNSVSHSSDEEQRLVDSNNVTAVLEESAPSTVVQLLPPPPQQPTPEKQPPATCEQAYTQCALRKVCAPALKAYNDDCQELISNKTSQCSAKCLKAMIALRSSEEGDDLVNCDCQGNEYCLQSKQRSLACKPQVEQAVDPRTVVSCSVASWICMADQLCSTALEYYYRNCQTLFSQRHCSMRCNNSLSILYRQPKASKLINCQCDGTEEFPCIKYKTYTERLCLNKLTPLPTQMNADNLEITDNNSNDQQEDEAFNLTNDSGTFILSNQKSQEADDDIASTSEEDDGAATKQLIIPDPLNFGGISNNHAEESANSDGIQLDEDNWIPLISGRYFTNMRQRKQQQQQVRQHQRQQQQVQAPQQQSRKAQKTPKQKTKPHSTLEGRRRYGRILLSTASHATFTCRPSNLSVWASLLFVLVTYLTSLKGF